MLHPWWFARNPLSDLGRRNILLQPCFLWLPVFREVDRNLSWFWHWAYKSQCKSADLHLSCTLVQLHYTMDFKLGKIAPTSNISFTCAWTSSTIGGWILWNLSLKGLSSTTLISCFAKFVQPNSPGSRKKMSWYSANRAQAATWFLSDHLSRPHKLNCWKSNFFLCTTGIVVCWIPCISSNFSRVLGAIYNGDPTFAASTWMTLMPLAIVIRVAIRFFTTTTTCLLPEVTLLYMFITPKPWGKHGPSSPFRDWVITYMLFPRSRVFIHLCIIKTSTSSFFLVLTTSFKWVGSTYWFATVFLWIKSPAHQQANNWVILNQFRKTNNSSISLSLITLMIQLMLGVPRVTGTWDPKPVESSKTRTNWST